MDYFQIAFPKVACMRKMTWNQWNFSLPKVVSPRTVKTEKTFIFLKRILTGKSVRVHGIERVLLSLGRQCAMPKTLSV